MQIEQAQKVQQPQAATYTYKEFCSSFEPTILPRRPLDSARLKNEQVYCSGFAGVPGFTPACFFACAINSKTLSLPS